MVEFVVDFSASCSCSASPTRVNIIKDKECASINYKQPSLKVHSFFFSLFSQKSYILLLIIYPHTSVLEKTKRVAFTTKESHSN